jgi:hypothetical protein
MFTTAVSAGTYGEKISFAVYRVNESALSLATRNKDLPVSENLPRQLQALSSSFEIFLGVSREWEA